MQIKVDGPIFTQKRLYCSDCNVFHLNGERGGDLKKDLKWKVEARGGSKVGIVESGGSLTRLTKLT